ncbi:MAG: molybdenum hydroxylase, partial [Spirochaetales bacterium]|nr:molybdenum hydroxylase [Spirochaetales bacterium]
IYEGSAKPNTGIPGNIGGFTTERVIHSPCAGVFISCSKIGDIVKAGDVIAHVGDCDVKATIDGMIRGLLHDGLTVPEHFKIADIDPRGEKAEYLTCSDKARSLSGSVLEAVLHHLSMKHSD